MRDKIVQFAPRPRPGSVHERSAANVRPWASIETEPAPATNGHWTHHLPSGQTLMIELLCSCANSSEPSAAVAMPSTIIGPDQAISHWASPETTFGIAAMSTGVSGPGWPCAHAGADSASASAAIVAEILIGLPPRLRAARWY